MVTMFRKSKKTPARNSWVNGLAAPSVHHDAGGTFLNNVHEKEPRQNNNKAGNPTISALQGPDLLCEEAHGDLERLHDALARWQDMRAQHQAKPWTWLPATVASEREQRTFVLGNVERAKDLVRAAGLAVEMDLDGQATPIFDTLFDPGIGHKTRPLALAQIQRAMVEFKRSEVRAEGLESKIRRPRKSAPSAAEDTALEQVLRMLRRFPEVARRLGRQHRTRDGFPMNDEYDVQHLLHGLLSVFFDDVRPEEWTPSHAGGSARMDFLLKPQRIVLEAKMPHEGQADRDVANGLLLDMARYGAHPDCGTLICFVYDPEHRIRNPVALERDLARATGPRVVVVVESR
ncbi:hypothetical protein LZC95_19545 [Pendulispora brunnea]|uniref:Uncharacterized protein n=1 Tax=Pendulispora brunnea TaxID=2905690 RepID=A0ABZ2KK01_9BACT